jgi:hypothetical protein
VPFVSILAALGMNVPGACLWPSARPLYVVLPLLVLVTLGLAHVAAQLRGTFHAPTWGIVEELAREVNRVTPRDGLVHPRPKWCCSPPGAYLPRHGEQFCHRPAPEQLVRLHVLP